MSFSKIFQSCQDAERLIMNGCVQWSLVSIEKIPPAARLEPGTARSVGQSYRGSCKYKNVNEAC